MNLLPSQKGCFLSHLRLWRRLSGEAQRLSFIMEDDPIFTEDFAAKFHDVVKEIPIDCGILFIGGRFRKNFTMTDGIEVSQRIVKHKLDSWDARIDRVHDRTLNAYLISGTVANQLPEMFTSIDQVDLPVDHWVFKTLIDNNIDVYNASPLLCHSTIGGDSDSVGKPKYFF